jgi:hypothetical protein
MILLQKKREALTSLLFLKNLLSRSSSYLERDETPTKGDP